MLNIMMTSFKCFTIIIKNAVAVYDGCGIVAFVYWLRLKLYL